MVSIEPTEALRFRSVSFSYRGIPVLRDASFHIHTSSFAALIGPNGAGKSTVLRLAVGLLKAQAGEILIQGKAARADHPAIGYVPQHASFDPAFPIRVREVVASGLIHGMGLFRPNSGALDHAMAAADISDLAERPYGSLSGGQRRRVLLARALIADPVILLLDEPTANLDSASEDRLFQVLAGLKGTKTILLVSHDSGFVSSLTDAVFCMGASDSRGTIVQHPTRTLPVQGLGVVHDTTIGDSECCGGHP